MSSELKLLGLHCHRKFGVFFSLTHISTSWLPQHWILFDTFSGHDDWVYLNCSLGAWQRLLNGSIIIRNQHSVINLCWCSVRHFVSVVVVLAARGVGLVGDLRWRTLRLKMKRLLKRAKREHKMATKKIPGLLQIQTHSHLHQMKVLTRIWLAFFPLSNQEMRCLDFSRARVNSNLLVIGIWFVFYVLGSSCWVRSFSSDRCRFQWH